MYSVQRFVTQLTWRRIPHHPQRDSCSLEHRRHLMTTAGKRRQLFPSRVTELVCVRLARLPQGAFLKPASSSLSTADLRVSGEHQHKTKPLVLPVLLSFKRESTCSLQAVPVLAKPRCGAAAGTHIVLTSGGGRCFSASSTGTPPEREAWSITGTTPVSTFGLITRAGPDTGSAYVKCHQATSLFHRSHN